MITLWPPKKLNSGMLIAVYFFLNSTPKQLIFINPLPDLTWNMELIVILSLVSILI